MNGNSIWLSGIECLMFGKYPQSTFNGHCEKPVLRCTTSGNEFHPTQKPVSLIENLIHISSNCGDIILDPFMGSGSTAIACLNTRRKFIGMELNDEYFEIAKKRIIDHTVQKRLI